MGSLAHILGFLWHLSGPLIPPFLCVCWGREEERVAASVAQVDLDLTRQPSTPDPPSSAGKTGSHPNAWLFMETTQNPENLHKRQRCL